MKKKKLKLDRLHKQLKTPKKINPYVLIGIIIFAVILTSIIFYNIGQSDYEQEQISKEHKANLELSKNNFINLDYVHAKEIFLKNIMADIMIYSKFIFLCIIAAWAFCGLLR